MSLVRKDNLVACIKDITWFRSPIHDQVVVSSNAVSRKRGKDMRGREKVFVKDWESNMNDEQGL